MTECGSLSKTTNCRGRQRFEKCFRSFLLFSLLIWCVAAEATVAQKPYPLTRSAHSPSPSLVHALPLVWKWLHTLKNKFTVLQQFEFYLRREKEILCNTNEWQTIQLCYLVLIIHYSLPYTHSLLIRAKLMLVILHSTIWVQMSTLRNQIKPSEIRLNHIPHLKAPKTKKNSQSTTIKALNK